MTAREIAAELEVSLRTVYRDVEALSAAGIPVYAEQGRTGGYQLVDGYRTRITGLTESEAQSLFMVGLPGPAAALGLSREAASVERKLLAALGPEQRERAGLLRDRFHLDVPAWYRDAEDVPCLAELVEALLQDRYLDVVYRRWAEPRQVERTLAPYGLVLKNGSWYVVGDAGRGPRTYRVSNILRLTPTGRTFTRPDRFELAVYWHRHLDEFERRRFSTTAVVRVSPALVRRLPDLSDAQLSRAVAGATPDPDGWCTVELPTESDEVTASHLARYGADLEVLSPASLREELLARAHALLALYRAGPTNGSS